MHAATVEVTNWWAKPRAEVSAWIDNYQKSVHVRHRDLIAEQVGKLGADTLLEVGAHCGPNLIRLANTFPTLRLHGIDANVAAVEAGRAWVKQLGLGDRVAITAQRFPGGTDNLPTGAFDVVLSCYTLAYLAPEDVDAALFEMGRLARKAVIIAEPMILPGVHPAPIHKASGFSEWAHDYQGALKWIGNLRSVTTTIIPVAPPVDRLSAILVVVRHES